MCVTRSIPCLRGRASGSFPTCLTAAALVLAVGGLVLAAGGVAVARPPNLIVILTDDMGYADLAAFGESEIPTPAIDRLAEEGTRCTAAYSASPICVPSRMALLSGRHPGRFGMYTNVYGPDANALWLAQTTLADRLRTSGYRTAILGKWHLSGNGGKGTGDLGGFHYGPPHERGFDEFVGIFGGMDGFRPGTGLGRWDGNRYQRFPAPSYLTDFFAAEACGFVTRNRESPFFLYLAFNAPHAPLQALDADQAAITAAHVSPDRRKYAGMVTAIDRAVGQLMTTVAECGLADETLTIFLNDNGGGGNNAESHTRNTARNLPYRGHKFDLLEGGIRVPMIFHWPGHVPAGREFAGLVSSMDVAATCLAAAEAPLDADGVDLVPFLDGRRSGSPHDRLCWQQQQWPRPNERKPGPGHPAPAYALAVREGNWKAIRHDQPFVGNDNRRRWELYDLDRDPAELNDLASEFPERVEVMAAAFHDWQTEMVPPGGARAAALTADPSE